MLFVVSNSQVSDVFANSRCAEKGEIEEISARIKENDKLHFAFNQPL